MSIFLVWLEWEWNGLTVRPGRAPRCRRPGRAHKSTCVVRPPRHELASCIASGHDCCLCGSRPRIQGPAEPPFRAGCGLIAAPADLVRPTPAASSGLRGFARRVRVRAGLLAVKSSRFAHMRAPIVEDASFVRPSSNADVPCAIVTADRSQGSGKAQRHPRRPPAADPLMSTTTVPTASLPSRQRARVARLRGRRRGATAIGYLRSPGLHCALAGLLAAMVIGAVGMQIGGHIASATATGDARHATRIAGEGLVAPAIRKGLASGDPAAIAKLDEVVRTYLLPHGVTRVKLWSTDGRIVYSDVPELIGRRFELEPAERAALAGGVDVDAEVSHLARPENRFDGAGDSKLLESSPPIRGADGRTYLFEVYQRFSAVAAGGERLWTAFAPPLVGLLVLLQLVNLPLARSFAGRLRRATEERAALLQRAVDASETERRTIAADLHDGVVQDLLSVSIGLNARADELQVTGESSATEALREGAARTREGVRALRTLLVDIYPPTLHHAGLVAALEDLAATGGSRGVDTSVSAPTGVKLDDAPARLLYRCGQEALRNVFKHARADHAWIVLTVDEQEIRLDVADDGEGFDPALVAERPPSGHIGLRSLTDLVRDAQGRLEIASQPGQGTVVSVTLPR